MGSTWRTLFFMFFLLGCTGNSVEEQAKRLGSQEFSQQSWALATEEERGKMVASFLSKHRVDALTASEIRGLLGAPTGYYDYDENLAYAVRSTAMDGPYGKAYLLVFVTDKHTGKVSRAMFVPEIGPRKDN